MGHILLGTLPRTRKWKAVIALVESGRDPERLAAATMSATVKVLDRASKDAGLGHATWLLTQLPLAARAGDYVEALRNAGLKVTGPPGVLDLAGSFTRAVDDHLRRRRRTDFGEMAQLAAVEALTATLAQRTRSLFGTAPEDVKRELGELGTSGGFGRLARDFFARLTHRYVSFYLSRELSNHVGPGRRFASLDAHTDFDNALALHCRQAAGIVEEFAGGWLSSTQFKKGRISRESARGFAHIALKKIRAELRRGAAEP